MIMGRVIPLLYRNRAKQPKKKNTEESSPHRMPNQLPQPPHNVKSSVLSPFLVRFPFLLPPFLFHEEREKDREDTDRDVLLLRHRETESWRLMEKRGTATAAPTALSTDQD